MFEKRGLSKAQFAQNGYDTSAYRFIETEGTFTATLDLKVWGDCICSTVNFAIFAISSCLRKQKPHCLHWSTTSEMN